VSGTEQVPATEGASAEREHVARFDARVETERIVAHVLRSLERAVIRVPRVLGGSRRKPLMKEQRVALLEIFAFGPLERGSRASGTHGRSKSIRVRSIRVRPGPDGPAVLAGRGAFVA